MALSLSPKEIVERDEHPLLRISQRWERVQLGDIATVQNGFPFKSSLFSVEDGFHLIRIRDVGRGETQHFYTGEYDGDFIVRRDDILIGMDGDFRAARWRGPDALLNQRVCRLKLETENYDEGFFLLCLQPYLDAVNAETSSVTVKHLSSKTVQDLPLPLPPLNEQRRIVEKIEAMFDEIDKGIESLQTARATLGLYRQSLLKSAFEGRLTADWRAQNAGKLEAPETLLARIQAERDARYKAALDAWQDAVDQWRTDGEKGKKPAKPKRLPDFDPDKVSVTDEGWTDLPLGQLIGEVQQGWSPKCDDGSSIGPDDWTVVTTTAVQHYRYSDKEIKLLPSRFEPRPEIEIRAGDFLMTRKGPRARTGVVCLVPKTRHRIMLCDTVYRFRCDETALLPRLLEFALNSPLILREIDELKSGISDSGISLNHAKIKSVSVKVPLSKSEQAEIVRILGARLEAADALEAEIGTALTRADALRQSILKKAFSGQLVPQDPDEEPASALLERIKTERAKAPKAKKRKTAHA